MEAKNKFREGWIMLLRPFEFGELSKPLQKMTILYAYSEQPLIKYELNEKGREEMRLLNYYSSGSSVTRGHHHTYSKRFQEDDEKFELRLEKATDKIWKDHGKQENYKGEIVQCYVEKQLCRFYPDEYNIISRETFEHLLTCEEHEYKIEVENKAYFDTKSIKDKIFYTQSRGIGKGIAMKMNSKEAKDSVIFRPQQAILEMFCRDYEIY